MEIRPILSALWRNKTGPILVAVQVALSLAILANALHIVQLRLATAARTSGIANEADVFNLDVRRLNHSGHQAQLAAQHSETATLRAVPGVLSVAATSHVPLSRMGNYTGISTDRKQLNPTLATTTYFTPDALVQTWGLVLVEGRDFLPHEIPEIDQNTSEDFSKSVIISRAAAQKLFPDQQRYVGRTFYFGNGDKAKEVQVVGVVEQLQTPSAKIGAEGEYSTIIPVRLTGIDASSYTLRAEPGQLQRVIKEAEAALHAASPTPVIVTTTSMADIRRDRYRADHALAWMLVAVSILLLLITASGIVGMASLWVTQRRKQIGVRRALGARRSDILRYFITENILITSVGIAAGVLLALALNQLLVSQLEMARLPFGYLVAGAAVFWALGVGAVYGPAWRAASISPATATRSA